MARRFAGPLLALAAGWACAQPGTPPGGEPDTLPPRVLETVPQPFGTLTSRDAPVVIRFDERISERLDRVRRIEDAVLVSPATSPVEVDRKRSSIEVELVRGWQPDLVYRVTILPVFSDLFRNQRQEPVELVFSTGAPIPETAVGGFVADRLTGQPVPFARVEARRRIDGLSYVAVSDTAGFFAIRYAPAGAYDVRAWLDQDGDRIADFFEARDSATAALAFQDTLVLELALLPGDSTPARLARAEPLDSTRIELLFDDYFEPGPVEGDAWVYRLPDSAFVTAGQLIHGSRLDSIRAAEQAVADSIQRAAADTLPADTIPADSAAERAPPRAAGPAGRGLPGPGGRERTTQALAEGQGPLPTRELIVELPEPLVAGGSYYVLVGNVTNIRGIPGGGGSARFRVPEPEPDSAGTAGPSPPDTSATGRR
jgi:hypothetical protein